MYNEPSYKNNSLEVLLSNLSMETLIFLLFFLIGLIVVLSIVTYYMAKNRGRSGGAWVLLFLCIGILAIIILACIGDTYQYEKGFSWVCPQCMTTNYSGGKCKKCGRERTAPHATTYSTQTNNSSWVCEKCGARNVGDAKNCTNCYAPKP